MEFTFTSEQYQFREVVQRFLRDFSPPSEVRRLMDTDAGFDAGVWQQMSGELALPAISIPEAYGGAGFVEQGILLEEMARTRKSSSVARPAFTTLPAQWSSPDWSTVTPTPSATCSAIPPMPLRCGKSSSTWWFSSRQKTPPDCLSENNNPFPATQIGPSINPKPSAIGCILLS